MHVFTSSGYRTDEIHVNYLETFLTIKDNKLLVYLNSSKRTYNYFTPVSYEAVQHRINVRKRQIKVNYSDVRELSALGY